MSGLLYYYLMMSGRQNDCSHQILWHREVYSLVAFMSIKGVCTKIKCAFGGFCLLFAAFYDVLCHLCDELIVTCQLISFHLCIIFQTVALMHLIIVPCLQFFSGIFKITTSSINKLLTFITLMDKMHKFTVL